MNFFNYVIMFLTDNFDEADLIAQPPLYIKGDFIQWSSLITQLQSNYFRKKAAIINYIMYSFCECKTRDLKVLDSALKSLN